MCVCVWVWVLSGRQKEFYSECLTEAGQFLSSFCTEVSFYSSLNSLFLLHSLTHTHTHSHTHTHYLSLPHTHSHILSLSEAPDEDTHPHTLFHPRKHFMTGAGVNRATETAVTFCCTYTQTRKRKRTHTLSLSLSLSHSYLDSPALSSSFLFLSFHLFRELASNWFRPPTL